MMRIAIFSISLLLFLSSSHGLQMSSTASPPSQYNALDQFSARVIASFIEGTIGGLLQERKGNYSLLELQLAFNCSSEASPSELMLALDQTMQSFYTSDLDYGLDAVTKGLSTLSETITQRFIPILQSCNASSDITSALNSAAQTLINLQTVNGTIAELIINQAEVYSEMASALGYWTRSNFFEAGVYLGVVLQKTRDMSNTSVQFCKTPPSDAGNTIMWKKFFAAVGEEVGILSDEKVIPSLNFPLPWDWCWVMYPNQTYPGTYICDPENSQLGVGQYYNLNLVANFSSSYAPSYSSFDQNYFFFLDEVEIFNLTTPELDLLNEAISAYQNMSNYANYIGYSGQSELAPLWNTSMSAGEYVRDYINNTDANTAPWVFSTSGMNNQIQFCSGNPGDMELGSLGQDFNQTFIQARRNGTWHDIEVDYFHSNFSLDISGMHLMRVNVTPGAWFIPETLPAFQNKLNGLTRESLLDSIITGIIVASKVTGGVKVYTGTRFAYNDFWQPGETETIEGLKIGSIFSQGFDAGIGEESVSATIGFDSNGYSFALPQIVGLIIRKLP